MRSHGIGIYRLVLFLFTSVIIALIDTMVFASTSKSNNHEDYGVIPWPSLIPQFLNFGIVVACIYFFARKRLAIYFIDRHRRYLDLVQRAENLKNKANEEKKRILDKLNLLKNTKEENLLLAKKEADFQKRKTIQEAEALAQKMEVEAINSIGFEREKLKNELRNDLIVESLNAAQTLLSKGVDAIKQKKLQTEFVEKIQAVK